MIILLISFFFFSIDTLRVEAAATKKAREIVSSVGGHVKIVRKDD